MFGETSAVSLDASLTNRLDGGPAQRSFHPVLFGVDTEVFVEGVRLTGLSPQSENPQVAIAADLMALIRRAFKG